MQSVDHLNRNFTLQYALLLTLLIVMPLNKLLRNIGVYTA